MKNIVIDGYSIKIGQNKNENQLLLETMKQNYTWFHIKDYPSAHLWVEDDFNNISKNLLYKCALELKKNSKFKKWNNIEIIYTLGKNLTLTNTPGLVITKKTKSIKV